MAGLDWEGDPAVPFQRGAGIIGNRPFAADLVEATALPGAVVVEAFGEQAALVEGPAIAAVVDGLAEKGLGPPEMVELRQFAKGKHIGQCAGHGFRDRRAARNIDDGLAAGEFGNRDCAGRVGVCLRNAAESRAGSDRHHGEGVLERLLQHLQVADAGDGRIDAAVPGRNGAVDHDDIFALVGLHRRFARRFRRFA